MKSNAGKVLLTTVAASLGWFATAQAQTAKPDLVAKVAAGELKKARASWWGFNAEDSTKALQDAINSRVPKLIVDNMGAPAFLFLDKDRYWTIE